MFSEKSRKLKRIAGLKTKDVAMDEILMDVRNIPDFHRESFEGVLENPIKKEIFIFLGFSFFIAGIVFLSRIGFLEIAKGESFLVRAEQNFIREIVMETERGIIFDRDNNPLTFNEFDDTSKEKKWTRAYPKEGFLHSIGFLSRKEDQYLAKGASGLELMYDDILNGSPNKFIEEINATGEIIGSGITEEGGEGSSILSTISSGLVLQLSRSIENTKNTYGFNGGAAVVLNPQNGEVLALLSSPEFDPNILSKKASTEEVNKLITDSKKPFFNRAISGLYPPGSIVKPAVAAGALAEGIISSEKQILSTTPIIIKNPFSPDRPDIFPDWKYHGWVDLRRALAISSDIYFYAIGGGYEDQKGLGVLNIEKYLKKFGFGDFTGVDLVGEKIGSLPDPEKKINGRKWSIGDTYHLSIGQGDLQVTPIAMALYASMLAKRGEFYPPHLAKAILGKSGEILEKFSYSHNKIDIQKEIFNIVREGMRDAVKYGTASGLSGYAVDIAAKTGTAEIGDTGRVHSWSIGFLPYDEPKVAWAIVMENGPISNTIGATFVASEMIQWIMNNNFLQNL